MVVVLVVLDPLVVFEVLVVVVVLLIWLLWLRVDLVACRYCVGYCGASGCRACYGGGSVLAPWLSFSEAILVGQI